MIDELHLTNLKKVFWPKEGYTKGDVIAYYDAMSKHILLYLQDRPQSLFRQPDGYLDRGFFHKDVEGLILPSFVSTIYIKSEHLDREVKYLLCQNKETLLYMANLGCIEINPWLSRIGRLDRPDFLLIDLDPGDRIGFDCVVAAARAVHRLLDDIGAPNFCKTSGKTGLHIVVPLRARYDYDQVRKFAELLAIAVNRTVPKFTSLDRDPQKRQDKIYLDFLQNRIGQTITAPYSLRPWLGATVSTPLRWSEVNSHLRVSDFNIMTIFKRLDKVGDLWLETLNLSISLNDCLIKLERILEGG